MAVALAREELLADRSLVGTVFCRAMARRCDEWLQDVFAEQIHGDDGIALAAVGGYGRAELCPASDLDLLLLHSNRPDIGELAPRLWYPIWDARLKLGHSVRTVKECLALAKTDNDTATALLTIRHLAGDADLTDRLASDAEAQWKRRASRLGPELALRVSERHRQHGEVAFLLEPDLKLGRGGLRDVHALRWLEASDEALVVEDREQVEAAYEVLLAARVELQRATGRASDQLLLEEQDAVAAALDYPDADALMSSVAGSARSITWVGDRVWAKVGRPRRRRRIFGGDDDGRESSAVTVEPDAALDAVAPLRVAVEAASREAEIDRGTLLRLRAEVPDLPDPWPEEARQLFVDLLLTGFAAIPVIEALDQSGLLVRLIPEWEPCRSRPQRNAYHRFTVDRHLAEAAAQAAQLVERVDRPDLLVVGALLHDIGKGYPGDHSEVGMGLVASIADRMGFPATDVDVLVAMVEHHLLLPDVATRRDLADDGTIRAVADHVGSLSTLRLLGALTEADSIATGPSAWSRWKADLVNELVARVAHVIEGGDISELTRDFPSDEHRQVMQAHGRLIHGEGDTLLVIVADRPALFSRVAATLSLHGLEVLGAAAHSEYGMALEVFQVEPTFRDEIAWDRVTADVDRAVRGRLAMEARLADRIELYERRRSEAPHRIVTPKVLIDNEMSAVATVVEVSAPDSLGLLFRVTQALSSLDLNILSAKVQTLGGDVVDTFYVQDGDGQKVTDANYLYEIERALGHAIGAAGRS